MRVYKSIEAAPILRIECKNPERVVNRLCREGKIRAQMPSKKQGWIIHEKAIEDYLLLKGS